jgi:hypothetical protein
MVTSQIVQTLIATIVGGCIVIATNWLSMRARQQESIQDWYEKTYVLEGLDPIIEYLLSFRLHVINADVAHSMRLPDISTVPIEALARVQQLLNETTVSGIIVLIHASIVSEERSKSISAVEAALDTMMYRKLCNGI